MFKSGIFRIFFVILAFSLFANAQSPHLSKFERCWSLRYPFAAIKVKRVSKKCFHIYNQPGTKLNLDNYENGGKLDAFRHIFFMAAFSQKVKVKKLRKLGLAHEKSNYRQFRKLKAEDGELPDSLSGIMDLRNNELGFRLGEANKKRDLEELAMKAKLEIQIGNASVMKRNRNGVYLDCDGKTIDLKNYLKTWVIPKCIVTSDYYSQD